MIALLVALLAVVNSSNNIVSYACDGVTATYTVNYPYLAYTDLVVTSTTSGGAVTTLVYTTDYTVNLASTSSTATLTINVPATKCPSGNTLKITRTLALTQPTSFKAQTTYNQNLHEQAYDRLAMEIQQGITANAPLTGNGSTTNPLGCLTATGSVAGCLVSADWTTFNGKLSSVTADSPLLGGGTSGSHLTCQVSGPASAGCLSSTDWNTFNNKSSNGVSLTTQNTWTAQQTFAPSTSVEGGVFTAGGGGSPATGAVTLTPQSAPSAPVNGNLWSTTAGLFLRANGATQGPFLASGQNPSLLAQRTSSQSISNNTVTIVIYSTVLRDTDSAYNSSTGRFTVPAGKGGDYLVVCSVEPSSGWTGFSELSIYKNALVTNFDMSITNPPGAHTLILSAIINLAAADVADCRFSQNSGSAATIGVFVGTNLNIKKLSD